MSIGGGEILVILLVALVVFGPTRLPDIARQVGKAMSEVRKMQDSVKREIHGALNTGDQEHVAERAPSYDEHQVPDSPEQRAHHEHPGPQNPDIPSAGSFS